MKIAVVAVVLLLGSMVEQSSAKSRRPDPPPSPPAATLQQPNSGQLGTPDSPFTIKVLPSGQTQEKSEVDHGKEANRSVNSWTQSDKIAAIAVIVGLLQFSVLLGTLYIMKLTAMRQLRAYLFLENAVLTDGTTVDPPVPAFANHPGCTLQFRNSGQTPAYKIISWAQLAVTEPINQNSLLVPPLQPLAIASLGSNSQMPKLLTLGRVLAQSEIEQIRIGQKYIFLYGRVEYRDAFNKPRFSNFRLHYYGQYPPPRGVVFFFSEQGNDAN